MASDIATAITKAPLLPPAASAEATAAPAGRRRGRLSPLTRRILAINVLALALLGFGLLYLGQYQDGLIDAEIQALKTQAEVFAAALGEGAVTDALGEGELLIPQLARDMTRRLVEPTHARARLFDANGALIGDSRLLRDPRGAVQITELPPPDAGNIWEGLAARFYDRLLAHIPWTGNYTTYTESPKQKASDYPEVQRAFGGDVATAVHRDSAGDGLILIAAVPVQRYKQVLGVVMLSTGSGAIEQAVRAVRFEILELFAAALSVTVLLSLYLAGTIARPVRLLAAAAERVRRGHGRQVAIPDFTSRGDEIGDLSGAFRDMTLALWQRMDAIEHFAADVAHEIKNPLTSLRSAVETAARVEDPEKQRRLLAVVLEDVERLDRLITDISNASRLDAELSRDEIAIVPLGRMLGALVDVYRDTALPGAPQLTLTLPGAPDSPDAELAVPGIEDRLVQVFRNLIANAISFSPPGGVIDITGQRQGGEVIVAVEDQGPGIPEGKLAAIFERFYSERPTGEKFGTHSGLGLAISKRIVETHHGSIHAENRCDARGCVIGARFVVRLPTEEPARRWR